MHIIQPHYMLTRYLYAKDEVEYALLIALLRKRDLAECYYWLFELYYSGFAVLPWLHEIYLLFYYAGNPRMADYIEKKSCVVLGAAADGGEDVHINALAAIVRNLFRLELTPQAFLWHQQIVNSMSMSALTISLDLMQLQEHKQDKQKQEHKQKYKKEKYTWLLAYPENCRPFLSALYRLDETAMCEHLFAFACVNYALLLEVLLDYYKYNTRVKMYYKPTLQVFAAASVPPLIQLLAVIALAQCPLDLDSETIFIAPNITDLLLVDRTPVVPLYRTLLKKRLYGIPQAVTRFPLARWQWPDLLEEMYFHWEYHACLHTPSWQAKLSGLGHYLDHDARKLVFLDDDAAEAFGELAAYEFDEQPGSVLELSHDPSFLPDSSAAELWLQTTLLSI
jgi:hypothetical protein